LSVSLDSLLFLIWDRSGSVSAATLISFHRGHQVTGLFCVAKDDLRTAVPGACAGSARFPLGHAVILFDPGKDVMSGLLFDIVVCMTQGAIAPRYLLGKSSTVDRFN
jgi:hypothetical protein